MTDVRFDRSDDGCCTLYVGRMLVFTDLTEPQARELAQAFGGAPIERPAAQPVPTATGHSVGGRSGLALPGSPTGASEQALARLW